MDKELFEQLTQSMKEAIAISNGEMKPSRVFTVEPPDAKAVREKTGLSQSEFARMIGVKVKTLQNWEQGRRQPDGPAKALLRLLARHPRLLLHDLLPAPAAG